MFRFLKQKLNRASTCKIYMGCGEDSREGYIGCDIRKTRAVDIVCKAWELSKKVRNVEEIYSRHMVEHLTYQEFEQSLKDWFIALLPGGRIHIVVPNLEFHIEQFQRAIIDSKSWEDRWSDFRWSLAGFYGWQREEYINENNHVSKYWDVHKSGYTKQIIRFFLSRANFVDISSQIIDDVHLDVVARKPGRNEYNLNSGERQVSVSLENIRVDHLARYEFALKFLENNDVVLDLACGCGYGSYILASYNKDVCVRGVDISQESINFANKYYKVANNEFLCADCLEGSVAEVKYDKIICFETIEHVDFDYQLLKKFYSILNDTGMLILSTPNQQYLPFNKQNYPFHVKHYYPDELRGVLENVGFYVKDIYSQKNSDSKDCILGTSGEFNIFLCAKK